MPLDEYRAKRDFARSPEPAGSPAPQARKGQKRFFCVQKHLATNLHYDFRIEHDGVLLSWAVPKGPSLDPATKRLAMHVEDHPLEYGEFEGVIPDGYGAGVVMLWDRGTWEPEVDDVAAALRKGDLKMRLDGYKLKGSWALIRTRGWRGPASRTGSPPPQQDDGRSWLLIKHRDEWSSSDLDITEFAPLSVKSEGDFADILEQELPDVWRSHRGSEGAPSEALLAEIVRKVERQPRHTRGGEHATAAEEPAPRARKSTGTRKRAAGGSSGRRKKAGPKE